LYYLATLDPEVRASFTAAQLGVVTRLLEAAIPQPTPKLVDLRFWVDLLVARFFVVLFVGRDRRRQGRTHVPGPLARTGNVIAATMLLLGLNLLISLFLLLLAYLVKSALGIDLLRDLHLLDFLKKFCCAAVSR